jgi:hypothetical protein
VPNSSLNSLTATKLDTIIESVLNCLLEFRNLQAERKVSASGFLHAASDLLIERRRVDSDSASLGSNPSRVVRDCFICFSLVGLAGAHAEVRDDHQARSATLLTASERANTSLSGHLQRSAIDRVRAHLNSQAVAALLC